jgi:nucleotide-binding universal stress UspA family protein
MNPKVIVMPLSGKKGERAALETAMSLAKKYESHLDVCYLSFNPYTALRPYTTFGVSVARINAAIGEISGHNERQKSKAEQMFMQALKKYQLAYNPECDPVRKPSANFRVAEGSFHDEVAIKARLADLVIVSQEIGQSLDDFVPMTTDILFGSGKPLLIIPSSSLALEENPWHGNDNVLIAWNGSVEASHAVQAALPYLVYSDCWVFTKQEREEKPFPFTAHDLVKYLKRHDMNATVLRADKLKESSSVMVRNAARKVEAGLIVMGAYTHNRIKENILGGVTGLFAALGRLTATDDRTLSKNLPQMGALRGNGGIRAYR